MIQSTLDTTAVGSVHDHQTACRSQPAPFLPHRRISVSTAIWSLLLGIALVCPAFLFVWLFPVTREAHYSVLKSVSQPGFVILMSTLLGPLLEEVIYRGLFLQLARRYAPVWLAIVLSSAVFAATHFMKGAGVILLAFPMGCLFAWMMVRTGSLWPGLFCHAVFDFAAVVFGPLFGINEKILAQVPGSTFNHPPTELFPAWWIVLSIVMAIGSFILLAREFRRRETVVDAGRKLAANVA
jgi:membrane protease YdiL (CAAX protease family)